MDEYYFNNLFNAEIFVYEHNIKSFTLIKSYLFLIDSSLILEGKNAWFCERIAASCLVASILSKLVKVLYLKVFTSRFVKSVKEI